MNVNFTFTDAEKNQPVRIEQVFAEKPGGGMVANPSFDVLPTTAVGKNSSGAYAPIKAYRLAEDVASGDSTIKVEKGSGIAVGDIIGHGTKGVACTAVDSTSDDFDKVTVSLAATLKKGDVLYQANTASTSCAPIYTPEYVVGNMVFANKGDQPVRFINGANLRKETACIASEVAALLPNINLV